MKKKTKKKEMDLTDLVGGIGIGLCFSPHWKVGILLLVIAVITAMVKSDSEKEK